MNNKICKVVFVGAGNMAREHLRAFKAIPGVAILGIFSRTRINAQTLSNEFGNIPVYDSVTELFKMTHADLVIVAVPELAVNQISQVCFEYPWTVLFEKPTGYNFKDAQNIEISARLLGRRAYVALNRRHYSSTRGVKRELAEATGNRFVQVIDQEDSSTAARLGRPPVVVDNWMYANSIHLVDYFNMFCRGELQNVTNIIPWNPANPDLVIAKLNYSSGDVGLYQAIWNAPGPWSVSISTKSKRWEMRPLERATRQEYLSRENFQMSFEKVDLDFKPGIYFQAIEATRAALGLETVLPTLKDGLETMDIIRRIYEL